MNKNKHNLTGHQESRDLIAIQRDAIDSNDIQGFVLAASDELIVLQYVYDFHLDGLMVLRVADITGVKFRGTDKFQKKLLEREGLLESVPFTATFDLRNWRSVIDQLSKVFGLMVLECEALNEDEFYIGRVLKTTAAGVQFREFSGIAKWAEKPSTINLKDITSCQVGTNYINVYQRHFARENH
jgi:hypothetical protein